MSLPDDTDRDKICRDQILEGPPAREALRIIGKLRESGFVAYLAGGCVRDALLGKSPKDYDVATDATPDAVREVFGRRHTLAFGASFGVIGVLADRRGHAEGQPKSPPTEVATFRSDGTYSDGRRPDSVHFGEAEADAMRRDFTINGLFYDPARHTVVDYVGGEADLRRGIIRTIGDANRRIEEDKLRMLRAVRFATTLGFEIADEAVVAIGKHADQIACVSGERIGAEMRRTLIDPNASAGLRHLRTLGLQPCVFPELQGYDASKFVAMSDALPDRHFSAALATLLLALNDPEPTLRSLNRRWKLSGGECRRCTAALRHRQTLIRADQIPWSEVQPVLIDRDIDTILAVATAEAAAEEIASGGLALTREALQWPQDKLNPPPLLSGDDLRELGVPVGPAYRDILRGIRDAQLNGALHTREDAVESIESFRP